MKKGIRILSALALLIVLLWLAIRGVDSVLFSMGRPSEAGSCNYEGNWESRWGPLVSGRILAELPTPLPQGEPFTVSAYVYFKVTSPYRAGRFVPMKMKGFVDDGALVSGGNAADSGTSPQQISYTLKGGVGNGRQTIDCVATSDDAFTQITGGYRSSSPDDFGAFALRKIR